MSEKSPRLGRGLAALIGDMNPVDVRAGEQENGIKQIAIEKIIANRANPRRDFDDMQLEELTASIAQKGVMQPLLVRPSANDSEVFELIAGERRWRASQRAGLSEVPVIIKDVDDKESLEIAIVENVQRTDLNSIEESMGYEQLIEEFSYTQNDLAKVIGKSRSHVANSLRLMKLPKEVRDMISVGQLTAGHARALITHDNPLLLAKKIIKQGLSVRQVEAMLKGGNSKKTSPSVTKDSDQKNADIIALEKRLSDALGFSVGIEDRGNIGKVNISYKSLEQLDDIIARLLGQ
jgi:ParB family chromosome partitioning protein